MNKKVWLGLLMSGVAISLAHASNINGCENLSVMITNTSINGCSLVNSSLKHGFYKHTSSVPLFIPSGTTAGPIFLQQSLFGPELELTYSCGDNKLVTFNSKQDYCLLSAGNVYGQIKYAQNTGVDYQAINGSWLRNQYGSITWRLQ